MSEQMPVEWLREDLRTVSRRVRRIEIIGVALVVLLLVTEIAPAALSALERARDLTPLLALWIGV